MMMSFLWRLSQIGGSVKFRQCCSFLVKYDNALWALFRALFITTIGISKKPESYSF